ncbi:MAG: ATP-binding protein [Deltaproteobacteria bacterium]|nr:ATP-binding protein [Deltaproteobacteria bacterium]
MIKRTMESLAFSDVFGRQMRFVVGPRQAGKTTLARNFLEKKGTPKLYYSWDDREIKNSYRKDPSFFMKDVLTCKKENEKVWLCFDEIHKMPKWKNILKGIFDGHEDIIQFIITGSARLDMLKYTGESLLGRYFAFRLFPLTLSELVAVPRKIEFSLVRPEPSAFVEKVLDGGLTDGGGFDDLLNKSGFPEPFLSDSSIFLAKWHNDYIEHYIKEDLRDLTNIHELEKVFDLIDILPSKIGNPLSLNSLREDIEVSHTAIRTWLTALKLVYVIFAIKPYSKNMIRSLKKAEKCYFFDWTRVENDASRFENYIACELFSFCSFLKDAGAGDYELFYVRTKDGLETDFLITHKKAPWILFEAKSNEEKMASHHITHSEALGGIPIVQLIKKKGIVRVSNRKYFTISADRFFCNLGVSIPDLQRKEI